MEAFLTEILNNLKLIGVKRHLHDSSLQWNNKSYRIRPDESFYFEDKVVGLEFEKQKRPVESVSKYWWLYKGTNWQKQNVSLELHLYLLRNDINEIRLESMDILGIELMKQFPKFLYFNHGNHLST